VKFTLPICPTPQKRARHASRGKFSTVYKCEKQKSNEEFIMFYLRDYVPEATIEGPVSLVVKCYMPITKSTSKKRAKMMLDGEIKHTKTPDCDNLLKNIMDCMTKMQFWKDDCQVFKISCSKEYSNSPRWEIELKEVEL